MSLILYYARLHRKKILKAHQQLGCACALATNTTTFLYSFKSPQHWITHGRLIYTHILYMFIGTVLAGYTC